MVQNRHSKPLTLGAAHAACLCGEDALLDGAPTPYSRCTCLYSVASSRGTHDGVSRFVWAIMFAPTIWRACVALLTSMRTCTFYYTDEASRLLTDVDFLKESRWLYDGLNRIGCRGGLSFLLTLMVTDYGWSRITDKTQIDESWIVSSESVKNRRSTNR